MPGFFVYMKVNVCLVIIVLIVFPLAHLLNVAAQPDPRLQCKKLTDTPSMADLQEVCKTLGKDWRSVCRYLSIPEWKLEEVVEQYPRDPRLSCVESLKWWVRGNVESKPPQYSVLMEELRRSERKDIADHLYSSIDFCKEE
jgi:hypothetical protein